MRSLKTTSAILISLGLLSATAQAGIPSCTSSEEMAALRTAAVQQQLMVAALTCQATEDYNRFVLAYRPELQKSDADLKDYFIRRGGERGEADYDTFKTKLANLSSLSDIANSGAYCANARAAFDMAMRGPQNLASFVADQRLMIALPDQTLCVAEPSAKILAVAQPVAGKSEDIRIPAHPAPLKLASAPAPVAVAKVPAPNVPAPNAVVAVAGVPMHDLPASPYGAVDPAPQSAPVAAPVTYVPQQQQAQYADAYQGNNSYYAQADAPPPPPRPLPPAYGAAGWPPSWGAPPYSRWYGQNYYYYYGR